MSPRRASTYRNGLVNPTLETQDSAIADFREGVGRLGTLSYQLRDETRLSVGLLDDLEGDVSDA